MSINLNNNQLLSQIRASAFNKIKAADDGDGKLSKTEQQSVDMSMKFEIEGKPVEIQKNGDILCGEEIVGNVWTRLHSLSENTEFVPLSLFDDSEDASLGAQASDKVGQTVLLPEEEKLADNRDQVVKWRQELNLIPEEIQTYEQWEAFLDKDGKDHDKLRKMLMKKNNKFDLEVANFIRTKFMVKDKISVNRLFVIPNPKHFLNVCFKNKDGDIVFDESSLEAFQAVKRGRDLNQGGMLEHQWYNGETEFVKEDVVFGANYFDEMERDTALYKKIENLNDQSIQSLIDVDSDLKARYEEFLQIPGGNKSIANFKEELSLSAKMHGQIDSNGNGVLEKVERYGFNNAYSTNLHQGVVSQNRENKANSYYRYSNETYKRLNYEKISDAQSDAIKLLDDQISKLTTEISNAGTTSDKEGVDKKKIDKEKLEKQLSELQARRRFIMKRLADKVMGQSFQSTGKIDFESLNMSYSREMKNEVASLSEAIWNKNQSVLESTDTTLGFKSQREFGSALQDIFKQPDVVILYNKDPKRVESAVALLVEAASIGDMVVADEDGKASFEPFEQLICADSLKSLVDIQPYTKKETDAQGNEVESEVAGISLRGGTYDDEIKALVKHCLREKLSFRGISKRSVELAYNMSANGMDMNEVVGRIFPGEGDIDAANSMLSEHDIVSLGQEADSELVANLYTNNMLDGFKVFNENEASIRIENGTLSFVKPEGGPEVSDANKKLISFYYSALTQNRQ